MRTEIIQTAFEVAFKCNECGAELSVTVKDADARHPCTVEVYPCKQCLDAAYEKGRDKLQDRESDVEEARSVLEAVRVERDELAARVKALEDAEIDAHNEGYDVGFAAGKKEAP